jgi:hypothetical protein
MIAVLSLTNVVEIRRRRLRLYDAGDEREKQEGGGGAHHSHSKTESAELTVSAIAFHALGMVPFWPVPSIWMLPEGKTVIEPAPFTVQLTLPPLTRLTAGQTAMIAVAFGFVNMIRLRDGFAGATCDELVPTVRG